MLEWDAPKPSGDTMVHLSTDRRAMIHQKPSPLHGEPDLFVVALTSQPTRVHPTLSSLEEAKGYLEDLLR